jgi:uncharacterized protein YggE
MSIFSSRKGNIALASVSALAISVSVAMAEEAPLRVITVTGTGMASAAPDEAQVSAGVIAQAATAEAALDANTAAMQRVFGALRDAGIEGRNVQTSNFSVSPQYEPYREGNIEPMQIIAYQVSNQVTVVLEDVAQVGETLDALVRSGANQLYGISFSISEPKPLEDMARRDAVLDAAAKARTLAEAAGVTLGPVISISEGGGGYQPPMPYMMRDMAMASAAPPPVAVGESTLSVSISITYGIQ